MPVRPAVSFTRRSFLLGTAGAAVLAACGDGDGQTGNGTGATAGQDPEALSLVAFFGGPVVRAGVEQRITFGVGDRDGVLIADLPSTIEMELVAEGGPVGEPLTVERHGAELPRPYFPVRFTPPAAGTYEARATIDGQSARAAFTVSEPEEVSVLAVGSPMVPVETPTVSDPKGVTPICTNDPVCPLHDVTLTSALAEGRPVAFLVATPAFCQTAVCGPVLDVLLGRQQQFAEGVRMVHAEVYVNPSAGIQSTTTTEAVQAYGLPFEPSLLLAGADGVLADRLDNIFDAVEVEEALARIAG